MPSLYQLHDDELPLEVLALHSVRHLGGAVLLHQRITPGPHGVHHRPDAHARDLGDRP